MATPTIPHLDRDASGEEIAAALLEVGCVIVDRKLDAAEMDRFTADMAPWFAGDGIWNDDFSGYKTRRVSGLIKRSAVARGIALDPTVLDLCDRLLLPNSRVYRLQVTHMVDIGPGELRQEVHRDDSIYPTQFHEATPDMVKLVHGMWAVTDFTADNGATTIVPGSHRWSDRARKPQEHEMTQAVMPKGSVAFYLGGTYHGGGANRSNVHRVGALFGYALGWLRQEEDMALACPPAVARDFPERLQRLIGYDLFSNHAGWVDDEHPLTLLREEREPEVA